MAEQNNLLPILTLAVAGVGAYFLIDYLKKKKEEDNGDNGNGDNGDNGNGVEPAQPGEYYPMRFITPARSGITWPRLTPNFVIVEVTNPYYVDKNLYVGMSMLEDATGEWKDFKLKNINIGGNKQLTWTVWPYSTKPGLYWIVSACWYRSPVPGDERIGEAETDITFSTI